MILASRFRPAWWLPGAHLQTMFPSLFRRRVRLATHRERQELPDGDFLDMDWAGLDNTGSIVLVLHGLEGSIHSHYVAGIMQRLVREGNRVVLLHFRNCSEEANRLARSYHSGETGDLQYIIQNLIARFISVPIAVIGFSLGGNVLLKWLGEQGPKAPLMAAIAVSVPFDLALCAQHLNKGPSRLYQWYLMRKLHRSVRRKAMRIPPPVPLSRLPELRSFYQFDDHITAPVHGFRNAAEYYADSSSRRFLKQIKVPTLILQARDDPFLPVNALPEERELSESVTLELSRHGGHVGFIAGSLPWNPHYWLESRIAGYLQDLSRH